MSEYDKSVIECAMKVRLKLCTAYAQQCDCDDRHRLLLNLTKEEAMGLIKALNLLEELKC